MDKIQVIIADDKAGYRNLIAGMLDASKVNIVAEAADGRELLHLLRRKHVDIILLDLDMPVMDGNEAFAVINKNFPEVKVVILSFYFEQVLVENYLKRGAKGYIPKDTLDCELLAEVLTTIQNGGVYAPGRPPVKKLFTERQKEILPLIFEGLTNKEISNEIYVTERAVEKQRQKIYLQSGAGKAMDFYKYAFTRGLQFLGRAKASKDTGPGKKH